MSSEKQTITRKPAARKRAVRKKPLNERHIIGFMFGICLLLTLFLGTLLFSLVALKIPDIRSVAHYKPLQTTYILSSDGKIVDRVFKENRTLVSIEGMPPLLLKAFVAAEDGRFFDHPGLDFISVLRAAINNMRKGGRSQGGSTITQQVAKSLLLSPEKTYLRKFKEAILAWRIDKLLSKEEILYIYLNQIYLGQGAHGVEAASQTYFEKHVNQLNLAEMAILAGLPQAPSRYNPLKHYKRAIARQRYVLNRMAADGYISAREARTAFDDKTPVVRKTYLSSRENGYYLQIVKNRASGILGIPLERAGIRIVTHLDMQLQKQAVGAVRSGVQAVLERQFKGPRSKKMSPQGALVSIEACSGRVKALVGGIDFVASPFDRASMARRPAGSVFKPFVYNVALQEGWKPESVINDAPLSIPGGKDGPWQPKNFSGRYHGQVSLKKAFAYSYNTPAVRLLQKVGLKKVHRLADKLGIEAELPPDLSLALGAVDVTLLEMTGAYTPYVCKGNFRKPQFIDRIEDSRGRTLFKHTSPKNTIVPRQVAHQMKQMLTAVIQNGTGKKAKGLSGNSGGKTGTSDNNRDAWFIGFHEKNVTGVWVGHDDNKSLGEGENGGRTAAPIWYNYMANSNTYRK